MVAPRQHSAPVCCACARPPQLSGLDPRLSPLHVVQLDRLGDVRRPVARHQVIGGALRWHDGAPGMRGRLLPDVLNLLALCRGAWMGHRRCLERLALGGLHRSAPRPDAEWPAVYLGVARTRRLSAARNGAFAKGKKHQRVRTGGALRWRRGGRGARRPVAMRSHQPARHDLWLWQRSPGHEPPRPACPASRRESPPVSDGWLRGRRYATCRQLRRAGRT